MTHQSDQFFEIAIKSGDQNGNLPNSSYKLPLHLRQRSSQYQCMNQHVSLSHHHHRFHQQQQQQGECALTEGFGDEIKPMQDLLQEKNDSLASLSLENVDAYQEMKQLTNQFKQSNDALERSKDEIWTLELEKQELIQQVTDLQQQVKRASMNHTRLIEHEQHLKQELDNMKQQQILWQDSLEKAKLDKFDLAVTRRKLSTLERQLSEYDTLADMSHSSKCSHVESSANTFLVRRNLSSHPTSSQSLPVASFAKKSRHHRQQHDQLIALNAELHTTLSIANDTIKELQRTLENERKKRMEMEMLWREAQETIEKGDNDSTLIISTSTKNTSTPPYSPSANNENDNDYQQLRKQRRQQFGSDLDIQCGSSKESRQIRIKILSLGEELMLADASDATTGTLLAPINAGNTESNYKDSNTIAPSTLRTPWILEHVSAHTNLDEIMDTVQLQHTSTDHTCTNSEIVIEASTASSIEQQQQFMRDTNENNGTTTASNYFYQASTRKRSSPRQREQHANDSNNNCNISDIYATESSGDQQKETGYIRALTRTMIGGWMWKYTRKMVGTGISEYKHKRFCWLHPYSKTLYWSAQEPGTDGFEYITKYVMMESFKVLDNGGTLCFLIQSQGRSLKIQCQDNTTYSIWLKSLKHLLIDVPPTISLTTTKNTDKGTQRLSSLPNYYHSSNPTTERQHVTHDLSIHHCLNEQHENLQRLSSPSSSTQYITMPAITPASSSRYLDSALSSGTMTGSSSISLPFSPQRTGSTNCNTSVIIFRR